jgi:DNA-directed RNA polymerase specialized sigma24 family protein
LENLVASIWQSNLAQVTRHDRWDDSSRGHWKLVSFGRSGQEFSFEKKPAAMSTEGSITRWIADLELGHSGEPAIDEAQEELWQRYFRRLVGLAHLKLGETPRAVANEEDVATAALNSFFNGMAQGRFPKLGGRHDLWPLLAKITARKALDQQRYLSAEKRGGGRLRGDSAIGAADDCMAVWPASSIETELQPDVLVAVSEACDRLMSALADEQLRTIARRRLEGYTNAEIAVELGVVERTVERRLHLIRGTWSQALRKNVASE